MQYNWMYNYASMHNTYCMMFDQYTKAYGIFTLSPDLSRFKSTNNKPQLYHTDIRVQVLIEFND